jgi:hypothetical protein
VLLFTSKLSYSFREQLMGIKSQITATAILSLAIAGCTIGNNPEANQPGTTPKTPDQTETAAKPPEPESTQTQPFAAQNPGLIEPTKVEQRIELTKKGRPDPFGEIVAAPISVMPQNLPQKEVPKLPPLPTQQINPQTRQPQSPNNRPRNPVQVGQNIPSNPPSQPQVEAKPPVQPVIPSVLPQVITPKQLEPVAPPPPQPTEARAVFVSGVVLIGQQPKAIIKAPNEPTSRYVQAGQRLASGVLVKRIEMNSGSDPVVVFEQFGIEVAKAVGEKPTAGDSKTAFNTNSPSIGTPL